MTRLVNPKSQKRRRQYLRNNATEAEKLLWLKLKGKQLLGYKFRRQQGVGKYILDFYCPEAKLAIEIDGATHYTDKQIQHDKAREEFVKKFGIKFLRVTNMDVYENLEGVLQAIFEQVEQIKEQPPLTPP